SLWDALRMNMMISYQELVRTFPNSYGGCITHYGGAAGPIIFAAGYNDIKSWWLTGTIIALLTFLLHMVVGIPWWGFLIQHGIL
ncbi:anion permease, partial [Klebsiella michiganensis]|uniref:anion permease n=1 Tax=Klebsiella michiganensis TaxID=1134687 RepID=UPI003993BE62